MTQSPASQESRQPRCEMLSFTRLFARMTCLAVLFSGCLLFGQAAAPKTKSAAPNAPPAAKSSHKKAKSKHGVHSVHASCHAQSTHGNPSQYRRVACPNECELGAAGQAKNFIVPIDDYVNDPSYKD